MGLDDTRPVVLSDEEQFEIQKNKFNSMNWTGTFYDIDANVYVLGYTDKSLYFRCNNIKYHENGRISEMTFEATEY